MTHPADLLTVVMKQKTAIKPVSLVLATWFMLRFPCCLPKYLHVIHQIPPDLFGVVVKSIVYCRWPARRRVPRVIGEQNLRHVCKAEAGLQPTVPPWFGNDHDD